jgi:hypothetical protein
MLSNKCSCAWMFTHNVMNSHEVLLASLGIASRPCRISPGERVPGNHWIGGWMGPRAGIDTVE